MLFPTLPMAAPPLTVSDDLTCIGCGYDLRTLSVSGACPECGRAVADSTSPTRLRFRSGHGVCWTKRGIAMLAAAILLPTLAHLCFLALTLWMLPPMFSVMRDRTSTPSILYLWSGRMLAYAAVPAALLLAGAIAALTLPHFPRESRMWRFIVVAAAIGAACAAVACAADLVYVHWRFATGSAYSAFSVVNSGGGVLLQAGLFAAWVALGLRFTKAQRLARVACGAVLVIVLV